MSTKRICYTRPDGGVSVVIPAPEFMSFATEAESLRTILAKDVPLDATNVMVTDVAMLPANRRFRNAWRQSGAQAPHVDMPLARLQRMNEVREERRPRLAKSDVDFVRAVETGNTTLQASMKDYRQKLRDLPATEQSNVDSITIPDPLAAWNPTWPMDPV